MEIVRGLHPRAVLVENVPDLTAWNDGAVLAGICDSLADLGYRADAMLLNAFDYGVPQHRSRLVIVATRPAVRFAWPEKTIQHTVADAIRDLPVVPPAQRSERLAYVGAPQSWLQKRLRRGLSPDQTSSVYDHITRDVRSDDAEAYALMTEGQTYADLPEHLQRYRSDIFDDKYKRLSWAGLSRSITAHIAKDGYWYIHPDQDRTLSVREAARIQTFPDWFRFAGRPSERYRQIGNAVPPLLAEAVGTQLANALRGSPPKGRPHGSTATFRRDILAWHREQSRQLPWRDSANPWLVLASHVCLSRANPSRAERAFAFLSLAVPSPAALVAAPEQVQREGQQLTSIAAWRELRDIADALVADHAGMVPESAEQLRTLPHVGEWLISAVVAYGWRWPAVVLDRGCARVAGRLRGQPQSHWQARIDVRRLAGKAGPDIAFNAAMSDLGALLCRPAQQQCDECPARKYCATALAGKRQSRAIAADDLPDPVRAQQ
jgi:DNA (cytosine-5)-methyltransferase 1